MYSSGQNTLTGVQVKLIRPYVIMLHLPVDQAAGEHSRHTSSVLLYPLQLTICVASSCFSITVKHNTFNLLSVYRYKVLGQHRVTLRSSVCRSLGAFARARRVFVTAWQTRVMMELRDTH